MELFFYIIVANALLGLIMFEWSWYQMKAIRQVNEERDSHYPAFRRYDAKKWRKWKFYLGAVTLLPFRFIGCFSSIFIFGLYIKILFCCKTIDENKPLTGCRRFFFRLGLRLTSMWCLLCAGIFPRFEYLDDYDYSEYLGPDFKKEIESIGRVSTLVSNHTSWCDQFVFLSTSYLPAFGPKKSIRKAPFIGLTCKLLNCIFISRGASEEQRLRIIKQIEERQTQIEQEPAFSQILLFPEGGTSNGRYILNFKKGAFASLKPVLPIALIYEWDYYSPSFDITPIFPQIMMQMSLGFWRVRVKVLPAFKPNQYLFDHHADKGKEQWEIFAWAVRDVIAKAGPLIKNEQPYREKLEYEAILGYKKKKEKSEKVPLLQNEKNFKEV